MKSKLFILICSLEILIIVFLLGKSLFPAKSDVLGATSSSAMRHEDYSYPKIDGLEHFYEPKPNFNKSIDLSWFGSEYNYSVTYTTNADGLRNPNNFLPNKEGKTFRIMTLGDSFTFGVFLNTQDTYPIQLSNKLNELKCEGVDNFEVLNLGVGAYDIRYPIERFKLRGQKYNPDLIIWLIIQDDFRRLDEKLIPRAEKYIEEYKKNGQLGKEINNGKFYTPFVKARNEIEEEVGKENIFEIQRGYLKDFFNRYQNHLLITTFENTDSSYKDMLNSLVNSREKAYFYPSLPVLGPIQEYPDHHPNPEGAKIIANFIKQYLLDNKIINCTNP